MKTMPECLAALKTRAAKSVLDEVEGTDWWSLKGGQLSHGMAKRVQLASALLGDPDVVLLDGQRPGSIRNTLSRFVSSSRRGVAAARWSSRATTCTSSEELCDAAAILDLGRLVVSGSIAELTAQSEEIHVMLSGTPKGAPTYKGPLDATVPLAELRGIPHVTRVELTESHELTLHLERSPQAAGPEEISGQALWV